MVNLADMSRGTVADVNRLVANERERSGISRIFNTSTGLVNYDLQRPAKQTEVYYFPILAMMPHVQGNGDVRTNFKTINKINTGLVEGWVPEGARQQQINSTLSNASAAYATFGLEDAITWEAKGSAQGFEDALAKMQTNLMLEVQRRLEKAVTFANANQALGTPAAPVLSTATTGGTFPATTQFFVACVALTTYGLEASSVTNGVIQPVTVTGPDGKSVTNGYGASNVSASSNITTGAGATNSISASATPVLGAVGYAWFVGLGTGTMRLNQVTTINSALLTAPSAGGAQLSTVITADNSQAQNAFDGLLSLAFQYGTVITQATGTPGTGTTLTSDGAGGVKELETLFQTLWDVTKVSPKFLVMAAQEANTLRKIVIAGGAAPLFRFNLDAGDTSPITAGRVVGSYLNMFTVDGGQLIKVILHPYCPKGTILAFTDMLPGQLIPGSNISQLFEFHIPSPDDEIHATQWPLVTREYRTGVYVRGTVAHYYPQTMGVITNIAHS